MRPAAPRNYAGFSDPKLDAMVEQQRAEFDGGKRRQQVREIVLYLIDHSPSGLLDHSSTLNGLSSRVQGFHAEGTRLNGRQYDEVWLGA